MPCLGGNQALVSGVYGGTLGAGGATGAEGSAFGQNPAVLRPGRMGVQLHFHRPYGLEALDVAEAGGFRDGTRWGVSAGWRQTGVDGLYAEDGFQVTQTLRLGRPGGGFPGVLDLGAAWNAWRQEWPGGNARTDWDHGLGLSWGMLPRLKAGAFVLGLPLDPGGKGGSDRILQWGLEADSRDRETGADAGPCQILRLDFRKTGETPWRTLAALSLSPWQGMEFTGGFAGPPFQASLGMRLSWSGWELDQALRYHRYLGRTWLSGLAYSRATSPIGRN